MQSSYSQEGMEGTKTFLLGEINSTSECVPRIRFPFDRILADLSSASVFQETTHTIERETEREREDEKKKREIQGLQHPLSPASKRRQKGPYRIPAETGGQALLACVNRNPYLCLSSTSTSVTPRHGGPRRGNRTREKEREVRGKNFRPPFVQQVLGSWPQMLPVCIHQFSSRIVR